jgi:hypothetical protein
MVSTVPRLFRSVVHTDAFAGLKDDVVSLVGVAVRLELGDVDRRTVIGNQFRHGVGDTKVVVVLSGNDVWHGDSKFVIA